MLTAPTVFTVGLQTALAAALAAELVEADAEAAALEPAAALAAGQVWLLSVVTTLLPPVATATAAALEELELAALDEPVEPVG